jgi:gentisate 1,2-dioxygenase
MDEEGRVTQAEIRQAYYDEIERENLAPLWTNLHNLVPEAPNTPVQAVRWDFDGVVRQRLMEAGGLITAGEAERRVLVLENPGLRGRSSITRSLYGGIQLVMPGEVAPAHRHTQSALRFVLEGSGGYTSVDGERTSMQPGDFVITPGWTWHDHGNFTDDPMIWLDVLDIPLVGLLDATFAEASNVQSQEVRKPAGDSDARFASNMFPVDWRPGSPNSPIFNYPYERARSVLSTLARTDEPDPCHGHKLRYVNPATGGHVVPTIGAFMQLLPPGFRGAAYRSSDSTIYCVVEGEGETRIGDVVLRWKPRDIFVIPSWARHRHNASGQAILFSASDRPVHEKLSLWREERGRGGVD